MKLRVHLGRVGVVIAALLVVVAVVVACASPYAPADPEIQPSEAGADAADAAQPFDGATAADATGDGSLPADAGLRPTPGEVDCFGQTCVTSHSDVCCFDSDAGTTSCAKACAFGNVPGSCDDRTDCAPGQLCCVGPFGGIECKPTCSGERLCHVDAECDVGTTCIAVPCRGTVIGACGPVGPYIKGFCSSGH